MYTEKAFLEISHKIHKGNTCARVSFLKFIKKNTLEQLFSCELCEISKNTFFTEPGGKPLILQSFLSPPSFHLFIASYSYLLLSVSVLQLIAIFYDSCSYLSGLLFLIPKTEFVSSFAFVLCSLFPSADWALLYCVIDRKVRDIIFKAIFSPSGRYQNIQDNTEYNSVLVFRIILKIFAVSMLSVMSSSVTGRGFISNL